MNDAPGRPMKKWPTMKLDGTAADERAALLYMLGMDPDHPNVILPYEETEFYKDCEHLRWQNQQSDREDLFTYDWNAHDDYMEKLKNLPEKDVQTFLDAIQDDREKER